MARCLAAAGIRRLIVPIENAQEAVLADGIEVLGAASLQACVEYLRGDGSLVAGVRDASPPAATPEARSRQPSAVRARRSEHSRSRRRVATTCS